MKIIENDCYIEYKDGIYHLYLLKNKKELKENNEDKYRIGGYFIDIDFALIEIIKFRQNKKYSFKEDWKSLKLLLNKYLKHKQSFQNELKHIYLVISKLKKDLFNYD